MRPIDADKLHYKRIHFYDIKDGECSGLKSAVVVFADEIDKNESARISPDDVRGVGEWILKQDNWWGDYAECSICHDEYTVPEGGLNFKFCPNCGSKMKGY